MSRICRDYTRYSKLIQFKYFEKRKSNPCGNTSYVQQIHSRLIMWLHTSTTFWVWVQFLGFSLHSTFGLANRLGVNIPSIMDRHTSFCFSLESTLFSCHNTSLVLGECHDDTRTIPMPFRVGTSLALMVPTWVHWVLYTFSTLYT